jgi:hypothetical protein
MTRMALVLLTVVAGGACAHREPARREVAYRGAPVDRVDRHADWVRLGERSVDGARDRDVISVGRREGAFRKLMIAVERNPIELHHLKVNFGDGSSYTPETRLVFGANSRSGVIDLPGSERVIRSVEFSYGNLPGSGRAEVELWGR